ncbi:MAG: diguanylate cyclase [Thermodesulfobacteriota bacterium]
MNNRVINILAIEDNPEDAFLYRRLLGKTKTVEYRLFETETAAEGLQLLRNREIDCILLDYNLPDMDGLELLEKITGDDSTADVPTIVLTGQGNEMIAVQAMKKGATDYLVKGALNHDLLIRTIRHAMEKKQTEQELRQTNAKLKTNLFELEKANQRIIEQQKALLEEERLKVLLQMAGATAHELNQPLMALLGNVQLLELHRQNTEKSSSYIAKIQQAADRIAAIVQKIQNIRQHEVRPYVGRTSILEINQAVNLLVVENNEEDFHRLQKLLKDNRDICIRRAMDHAEALQIAESGGIHLIFLADAPPAGLDVDFLLELDRRGQDIPVVILAARWDEIAAARMIQAGACDYLPKSRISRKALSRIIRNSLEKTHLKQQTKEALKQAAELASRDELTGLYNRKHFREILNRKIGEPETDDPPLAFCILHLDGVKNINAAYGHDAGDNIIKAIARLLISGLRQTDIPCRYGGVELAALFPGTTRDNAISICDTILRQLAALPVAYKGAAIQATASIGIAVCRNISTASPDNLFKLAESAMLAAKKQGSNRVVALEI